MSLYLFLIKRIDGEWFDLQYDQFAAVLKPRTFASRQIAGWGDPRIYVEGEEIAIWYEDPGIQIRFENKTSLPDWMKRQIVDEICRNVIDATGQSAHVVEI